MYKELIHTQFAIECGTSSDIFSSKNLFFTQKPSNDTRSQARCEATIICRNNAIYCRSNQTDLTKTLESAFKHVSGEWFFEIKNIEHLDYILASFDLKITGFSPFFVPTHVFPVEDSEKDSFRFFSQDCLHQFKEDKRIIQSFCYSDSDPDMFGIGYYRDDELLAIGGANSNGRHIWEIGIERLSSDSANQGIATRLVKRITAHIQATQPTIIPIYGTQFSHVKSINVAIRSGFELGWSEIFIGPIS